MKFTLSWLREHLETTATVDEIVEAMTRVGMEVEHVLDPATKLAAFSVAKIIEAVQHPNADRLRVCQVDTVDGRKEIVCGAPNARAGSTTIYAPIGTYIPGSGITLEPRAVRGVVSNGMLCSAAELGDGVERLRRHPRTERRPGRSERVGGRGAGPGGGDRFRGHAQPSRTGWVSPASPAISRPRPDWDG